MNKKRLILFTSITFLSLVSLKYEHKYNDNYQILSEEDSLAYASYSDGLIYIGDKTFLENISPSDNDILILDERDTERINIKIYSSYKILNKDLRNDILSALCSYEENNPSEWNRTIESMRLEWFIHNLLYYCNFETNRTKDVDFENTEEKIYDNYVLRKILKI